MSGHDVRQIKVEDLVGVRRRGGGGGGGRRGASFDGTKTRDGRIAGRSPIQEFQRIIHLNTPPLPSQRYFERYGRVGVK